MLFAGLYENIYDLENDKSITFLYRAPRIVMEPLNPAVMSDLYEKNLGVDSEKAKQLAGLTKGYSYAFQVLGFLLWQREDRGDFAAVLPEYDQRLAEYVYEKIWSELSDTDQKILLELAKKSEVGVKELRELLSLPSNKMAVYRERLKRKGLIDTSTYGRLRLALPRFAEYVLSLYYDAEEEYFVRIPQKIREKLCLTEDSRLEFQTRDGDIVLHVIREDENRGERLLRYYRGSMRG